MSSVLDSTKPQVAQLPLVNRDSKTARPFVVTYTSLRVWGKKSVLSLVDQGCTSAAGFGVNVFLARWMPAEVYGAFAVAFAAFLFVSGFHNVLLLEPMSVLGPSRYVRGLPAYFRTQLKIHTVLVGGLSIVTLLFAIVLRQIAPGSLLVGAVSGVGLALPFLLLLWLARRMCYVVQRPSIAVIGSVTYLVFVTAGLFLLWHLDILGAFSAFLLMGFGSLISGSILIWRMGLFTKESRAATEASWLRVLEENWTYGRWLAGGTVLFSLSNQMQTFLVAALLGLGAAGIFRAVQIPTLVMTQVVFAVGPLILPAFSYDFGQGAIVGMRRKASLVSLGLGVAALCFMGILAVFATPVEHLLFGEKYTAYAGLIWLLALIPVSQGFSMGYSMALRASQTPHFDLVANAIAAPVAVLSAVLFIHWFGLKGAAISLIAGYAVYAAVTICAYCFYSDDLIARNSKRPCGHNS